MSELAKGILDGIGIATGAIVAAEIALDYSLGDKVKDLVLAAWHYVAHGKQVALQVASAQYQRAAKRLALADGKLKSLKAAVVKTIQTDVKKV